MKSTKLKIASALSFAIIGLTAFSSMALAQTTTRSVELADLLNQDIDQTVEINTNVTHPFGPVLEGMASSIDLSDTDLTQEQIDALTALLGKNKITFATKNAWVTENGYSYPEPDMYVSFHATREDLMKIHDMDNATSEMIGGIKVDIPNGEEGGTFIGYFSNLVVITDNRENMNTLVNNYNSPAALTLSKNPDYAEIKNKTLANSFLNMYINPSQYQNINEGSVGGTGMPALDGLMAIHKELMEAIKGEGFSVAQTSAGFNFSVFVKGDKTKLSQLNLTFDRYNFVPELYKFINNRNLMFYGEESNVQGKIKDLMKLFMADVEMSQEFTNWKNKLKAEGNVDFDTEVLPLLGGKYAMSIHKTDQIWPAVTMVIDVRNIKNQAGSVLSRLVDYADKSFLKMETDEGVDFYNRSVGSFNGTSYYDMTFDPTAGADSDFGTIPREKALITLHTAVTTDGLLVITNAPNVADVYTLDGKGMMNISSFNQAVTPNETLAGIGYMSVDAVQDYVTMLMDMFQAPLEAKEFMNGLLNPWHDVFTKGYATADTAWASGFVNVDAEGLARYGELFESYFSNYNNDYYDYSEPVTSYIYAPAQFCDVQDSDWFAPYVEDLAQNEIVSGYEDGCFRPANEITRAEFLKMAMAALGVSTGTVEGKTFFSDVKTDGSEWYDEYINVAANGNLVTGYSDGTFRPNALITRAEALQMLFNMSNLLNSVNTSGTFDVFADVHENDWFIDPVNAAYAKGLVEGVSQNMFEPTRNLNRAEAAKMIKLFRDMELGN